jgi:hypothetical protein
VRSSPENPRDIEVVGFQRQAVPKENAEEDRWAGDTVARIVDRV